MAIPLILAGVGVAAAVVGAGKGVKAVMDNNEADSLNTKAKNIIDAYSSRLETSRKNCEQALSELGASKIEALSRNLQNFVQAYEQLKDVDIKAVNVNDGLQLSEFSYHTLNEIKQDISMIETSLVGAASGAAGGALIAFGAYNGTTLLATTAGGTVISGLSGAAATNATLAWLGGGSIAGGGLGIAGGTMALGAIAAGPALLIAGWYMGAKAETALNDARSNKEKAEKFREDVNAAIILTDGIAQVSRNALKVLSELKKASRRATRAMENIISDYGTDYKQYDSVARETVLKAVKIAQLLKAVIDTPILDKDGALLADADANIHNLGKKLLA